MQDPLFEIQVYPICKLPVISKTIFWVLFFMHLIWLGAVIFVHRQIESAVRETKNVYIECNNIKADD